MKCERGHDLTPLVDAGIREQEFAKGVFTYRRNGRQVSREDVMEHAVYCPSCDTVSLTGITLRVTTGGEP